MPEVRRLVEELRDVGHDEEAVRESRRYPQHSLVVGGQRNAGSTAEVRRASPHVDRNVVDLADHRPHELALRVLDLVVKAAQHVASRSRVVVLHERRSDAGIGERTLVPALVEEAAVVAEHARLDQQDLGQRQRRQLHQRTSSRSNASRYWP